MNRILPIDSSSEAVINKNVVIKFHAMVSIHSKSNYLDEEWAHVVPFCHLSACVEVLFFQHCLDLRIATFPISSTDLEQREK